MRSFLHDVAGFGIGLLALCILELGKVVIFARLSPIVRKYWHF